MSTVAPGRVRLLCTGIEKIFPSAVCSGIVGDRRHRLKGNGSYHLSRQDNPARSFSVTRPDDRAGQGPDDLAAGFDISMSRKDMMAATARLRLAWANASDPRRKYLNAFNGWDGAGDALRFDLVARTIRYASPDHKWHVHGEIRRRYVTSGTMVVALLSALRGETVAKYLRSIGIVPATPPSALKAAPKAPAYPGRVLRAGNVRPDAAVRVWQQRMIARGWRSIGKADGLFGGKTEAVVRRWQKECRIGVDGDIGPKTWPTPWTRPMGG